MKTQASIRQDAKRILPMIDLTNLNDECTQHDIHNLCELASGHIYGLGTTAAVCIWPDFVTQARRELVASNIHIATVVNFPHGTCNIDKSVSETKSALADGADEIDLVFPYHSFIKGEIKTARALIESVRLVIPQGATLKVILETGALRSEGLIRSASQLAIEAGADFIKTSTGKIDINATLDAAEIMLEVIKESDRKIGIKPAGGIRTVEEAAQYLKLADTIMGKAWAEPDNFRFGASSLLNSVNAAISQTSLNDDLEKPGY